MGLKMDGSGIVKNRIKKISVLKEKELYEIYQRVERNAGVDYLFVVRIGMKYLCGDKHRKSEVFGIRFNIFDSKVRILDGSLSFSFGDLGLGRSAVTREDMNRYLLFKLDKPFFLPVWLKLNLVELFDLKSELARVLKTTKGALVRASLRSKL